jgi:polyphosphate kinase
MPQPDLLAKSAFLLREFRREAHALPVRLRILNMLTYSLDVFYIQRIPLLLRDAAQNPEVAALVRDLAATSARLLNDANETFRCAILPRLAERGFRMCRVEECSAAQQEWIGRHFTQKIRPLLTPLAVDAGRPFPQISAHSLNLLAVVELPTHFDVDMPSYARLKIPRWVSRLIEVDPERLTTADHGTRTFVLSEDMVRDSIGALFPGMQVVGVYQFRILRGSVLPVDEPMGRHTALVRQKAWPVVRIDVEVDMPGWVLRWLQENMEAQDAAVLRRERPLGIGTLATEWADHIAV